MKNLIISSRAEKFKPNQSSSFIGLWTCNEEWTVYNLRSLKKSPRNFCFILRRKADVWPTTNMKGQRLTAKEFNEAFEETCKIMCAFNEADRADWVASIQTQTLVRNL